MEKKKEKKTIIGWNVFHPGLDNFQLFSCDGTAVSF